MAREQTTKKVLEASMRLFNREGHAKVSTNHIAQESGLSPGNLYYYFKNKQAIIQAVFEWVEGDAQPMLSYPAAVGISEKLIPFYLNELKGLLERYRFFFRELPEILRNDLALTERYRRLEVAFHEVLESILHGLVAQGILQPFDHHEEAKSLARTIWLMAVAWLAFYELGPTTEESESGGVSPLFSELFYLLRPHICDDQRGPLRELFNVKEGISRL